MTQKQYDAQTPEIKKWYEPFKCKNCTTPPQPEQEPTALPDWFNHAFPGGTLEAVGFHMPTPRAFAEEMYKRWKRRFEELSTPPQRTWVGLTDEDVHDCLKGLPTQSIKVYARSIEAKLKQKNGYAEENT